MREIKFRVWDKEIREMYIPAGLHWNKERTKIVSITPEYTPVSNHDNHLIVMQYTGLLDKNGVNIYEGDIVCDVNGNIGEIKWNNDRWSLYNGDRYWMPTHSELCEIVGNIYENQELLSSN